MSEEKCIYCDEIKNQEGECEYCGEDDSMIDDGDDEDENMDD